MKYWYRLAFWLGLQLFVLSFSVQAQSKQELETYLKKVLSSINNRDVKSFNELSNFEDVSISEIQSEYFIPNPSPAVKTAIAKSKQVIVGQLQSWIYFYRAHPELIVVDTIPSNRNRKFEFVDYCIKKSPSNFSKVEGAMLLKEPQHKEYYVAFFDGVHFKDNRYYGYFGGQFMKTEMNSLLEYDKMLEWEELQKRKLAGITDEFYCIENDSLLSKVKITWLNGGIRRALFYNMDKEVYTYEMSQSADEVKVYELYKRDYYIKIRQENEGLFMQKLNENGTLGKSIRLHKIETR